MTEQFQPYANESQSLTIGGLTIENHVDRIQLYGSVDLSLDKAGLNDALLIKAVLDQAVSFMQGRALPDHIAPESHRTVMNPFKGG